MYENKIFHWILSNFWELRLAQKNGAYSHISQFRAAQPAHQLEVIHLDGTFYIEM